jgi:plastocyanin
MRVNHAARMARMAAVLLLIAACGNGAAATTTSTAAGGTDSPAAVTIDNFAFMPSTLGIALGTTVTWANEQGVDHTVTADDSSFDSGPIARGADFSQKFDAPGTYAYHCTIHPSMTATVTIAG